MRRPFLFLTSAFVALAAGDARGDDAPANAASGVTATATSDTQDSTEWFLRRKHTIAELELGFIALPTAPISQGQSGGNVPLVTIGHGDATVSLGFHLLYRGGADWAIGAGALFAPHPTADPTYGGASGLQVTHSRDYLWMGAEGRYIPVHLKTVEAWIGLTAGGVVVADRYDTAAPPVPSDSGHERGHDKDGGALNRASAGGGVGDLRDRDPRPRAEIQQLDPPRFRAVRRHRRVLDAHGARDGDRVRASGRVSDTALADLI